TAFVAVQSYRTERLNFMPAPPGELLSRPDLTGIPGLREVVFPNVDRTRLAGWFVAPRNRATIVLLHGTSSDPSSLVWDARAFTCAGFGFLSFDSPGYGASEAMAHGDAHASALGAALDWLVGNANVDSHRIGALGFSNGGYVLAQYAPRDTRLRAIV